MRTRERQNDPTYGDLTKEFIKDGDVSIYDTKTHMLHSKHEKIRDIVTPKFFKRIGNGDIINNPCYISASTLACGGGSYSASGLISSNQGHVYSQSGGSTTLYEANMHNLHNNLSAISEADLEDMIQRSRLSALSNVDSTPFAFGEDILEIRETLRFLKRPLSSLAKVAKKVRRLARSKMNARKGLSLADALAEAYLEYRFAVTPLVRSSMSIVEAYSDKNSRREKRRTARGFSRFADDASDSPELHFSSTVYDNFHRSVSTKIDVHSGILYEVKNPVNDLNFRLGLRLKDIPVTLWQIVPLSFMVDRVVDISSAISGFLALSDPSVTILAGWTRVKTNKVNTLQFLSQVNPGWAVQVAGDVVVNEEFSYSRTPWSPGYSDLNPQFTPWNLVKDVTSTLDLLALSRTRLKG